jgi:hypothetical protein
MFNRQSISLSRLYLQRRRLNTTNPFVSHQNRLKIIRNHRTIFRPYRNPIKRIIPNIHSNNRRISIPSLHIQNRINHRIINRINVQSNNRIIRRPNILSNQGQFYNRPTISINNGRVSIPRIQHINRVQQNNRQIPQPKIIKRPQAPPPPKVKIINRPRPRPNTQHRPVHIDTIPRSEQKYAILVGLNYENTPYQLEGCIIDVQDMKNMLNTRYGFALNCILMMTDKTVIKPTKDNILRVFKRIIDIAKIRNHVITELVFVYSGHGSYILDKNNDETDNQDETIISLDLKRIADDEINASFKLFTPNVKITTIFDSCFSGTMMDCKLSYNTSSNQYDTTNRNNANTDTKYNKWLSLASAKDNQVSQEGPVQLGGGNIQYNGYFIRGLLDTLNENNYNISYKDLLRIVQEKIKNKGGKQNILLSANQEMSIDTMFRL